MDRTLERSLRGRFEGEAALAGSTRARDRDQANIGAREQLLRGGEVVLPADEAMMECGQRRATERREWGEVHGEPRSDELVERLAARDCLSRWSPR